jgi:diaminopimelate epimerase
VNGSVIYKLSGSGNDFVMLDGRYEPLSEWPAERIRAVCARGTGVGADGLAVLEPGTGPARVRFSFFNSDGSRAPMCGNGALCATRLATWLEMAPATGLVLETEAGEVRGRCLDGDYAEIELPELGPIQSPQIALAKGERAIHFTTVGVPQGVPHLVVLVDDLREVPVPERGRELRMHRAMAPAGTNVNFVAFRDGEWAMRTYERGVEAETLACGTGATSAAAVLSHRHEAAVPLSFRSSTGTILTVTAAVADDGSLVHPCLAAPARIVFRGVLAP